MSTHPSVCLSVQDAVLCKLLAALPNFTGVHLKSKRGPSLLIGVV